MNAGRPDQVLLLTTAHDSPAADRLQRELVRRHFPVDLSYCGTGYARAGSWDPTRTHVVAFVPRFHTSVGELEPLDVARQVVADYRGFRVTLILREAERLPREVLTSAYQVVCDSGKLAQLLANVVRTVTGPWPSWLDARFAPEEVVEPTGVAWCSHDLLVADSYLEHLVHVDRDGGTGVVLPGLAEPRHVSYDRRRIFVANVGADSVLTADLVHGQAARIREVQVGSVVPPRLGRPYCAVSSARLTAIADSANNRVVIGHEDHPRSWRAINGRGTHGALSPRGLLLSPRHLWITNSDAGVVDVVTLGSGARPFVRFGAGRLGEPRALALWRDLLIVADDRHRSMPVFRVRSDRGVISSVDHIGDLALPALSAPSDLAVSRGRLAVADREFGCVWTVDLDRVPSLAATGGPRCGEG